MNDHTPTFPDNITEYALWVTYYGLTAPYGYCQCGCGKKTKIAKNNHERAGHSKGEPIRYLRGHHIQRRLFGDGPNLNGLCMCGCGQTAPLAPHTDQRRGWIKDQPLRFVHGHNGRGEPHAHRGEPKRPMEERFWEKVDKHGPAECWEWQANRQKNGYGTIHVGTKPMRAHRLSYQIHFGPIPNGKVVMHKCDNPACVNPQHLRLGTQKENVADMIAKGRQRKTRR